MRGGRAFLDPPVVAGRWLLLLAMCLLATTGWSGELNFNRDIRPILSENCFLCHGPDEDSRAADLRLDFRDQATEYAIVPGDAESSELIARISSTDPDLLMPPPDSERSLSAAEIEILRRWVDKGAKYQTHWSFNPPDQSEVPPADSSDDGRTTIDRFIDHEIRQRGLVASPPADPETLIRRATFDLTGLPPTLAELDEFLADTSAQAYSKLLDRLLQSEHYGERMAADWLDVARYSDTYGYQVDRDRSVWPWRDWVVDAFNRNLPYDEFITAQLAGDLLPDASDEQILATTFNRLHPQKVEGGSVPEEFRVEYVADRTQTVATGIMGLTYECCRCHNHKFDPLTQREYYQLSAFFDQIDEAGLYSYFTESVPTPTLTLPTPTQRADLNQLRLQVRQLKTEIDEVRQQRRQQAKAWAERDQASDEVATASPLLSLDFEQPPTAPNQSIPGLIGKGVRLTGDDGIATEVGNFRRYEPFSVSLWMRTPDHQERAVIFHRSRAWTDAGSRGYQLLLEDGRLSWSLIHFWPGNAIRIRAVDPLPLNQWVHVVVRSDGSSRAQGLDLYVNGQRIETITVRDSLTKQITGGGGDAITIGERFRDRGFKQGDVDEFQVFDQALTPLEVLNLYRRATTRGSPSAGPDLHAQTALPLAARIEHFQSRLDETLIHLQEQLQATRRSLCELEDQLDEIMVMRESPEPRQSYLLHRGLYDQPGEPVQPGTPQVLPPFAESLPRNRLGLACWLTDSEHPLTSRVAANRLWQICFGVGLVTTPEDFGSQGAPPTHPELLDWLARDLVEHDWDIKRALKQIMLSAAYCRSSRPADRDLASRDPANQTLARFPSYRLSAEMLRDQALAVSGRLVRTIGGPPVKPYEIEASFKPSEHDEGERLYRRSLYTYWKRTAPAPAMLSLDAAKRDVCQVRRERTASPLQALILLNGPQYVEAARGLAEQVLQQHGWERGAMLSDLFRTLTSHQATESQLEIVRRMHQQQLDYFRMRPGRAMEYLAVGEAQPDPQLDADELAATAVVAGALMNYDLAVTKR